ncbi:MAG: aspartate carbamoyltransferase catalytic subunit [Deltaproteobacteria bacterium]|nr:aspartate carbamoyltransferase catalytic subunit [Candidatus Anaeroferrophillus wilburensis]MBN2889889.1 aspartate carbamoyltransferase catalytic subunit [Deltaproteobacteria bacterium]
MEKKIFPHKDLLAIEGMTAQELMTILETAESFKEISRRPIKKVPTLRGQTVINLFYEPSTRTRTSFEIAAKRLSADAVNISASTSSVVKGETLSDTVKNLQAMVPDIIVVRHSCVGAPHFIASRVGASVVNAGDGANEHPTQALLDLLTIKEHKKTFADLQVAIIGDIVHSRVARSNMRAFALLGIHTRLCGPPTMMPRVMAGFPGVRVYSRPEEAIDGADVVMMLRIQLERQEESLFPSGNEYARLYGLNRQRLAYAKDDVIIMHPGPMNRGVEITSEIADGSRSVILDQVENGVAVRMAVLYLLGGHTE